MAGIENDFFVSINEISKRLDIPAHTLRYWEKQFPTVVRPITGAGGRRYYRPDIVIKIEKIKFLLYTKGMTIAGVKRMIHDGTFSIEDFDENDLKITQKQINFSHDASYVTQSDEIDTVINLLQQAKSLLKQT